jgi:hypothetical protein
LQNIDANFLLAIFAKFDTTSSDLISCEVVRVLLPPARVTESTRSILTSNTSLTFEQFVLVMTGHAIAGLNALKQGFDSFPKNEQKCIPINLFQETVSMYVEHNSLSSEQAEVFISGSGGASGAGVGFKDYARMTIKTRVVMHQIQVVVHNIAP